MIRVGVLEQISTFFSVLTKNKNILYILAIAMILLVVLEVINHFKTKKIKKIILLVIYILGLTSLLYFHSKEFLSLIDNLINNIFVMLLFPNLAVYTLVIIISNVIMIRSIISNKYNKTLKRVNMIFFVIFNIMFYLIIDNIVTNKINVYQNLSIYTNNNLLVLIQLSMYLFIIWLIILLINNLTIYIYKSVRVKEKVIEEKLTNSKDDLQLSNVSRIPKVTSNTIVVSNEDIKNIKSANIYNEYIDIEPVKKKKVVLSNVEHIIDNKDNKNNMDVLFGKNNVLNNIMNDIEKLKNNKNDSNQIKKIYEQISLSSNDLTLKDYNCLIKALKEIKKQ